MSTRPLPTRPRLASLRWAALMLAGLSCLALAVSASATVAHLDSITSWAVHAHVVESVIVLSYAVTALGATKAVLLLSAVAVAGLAALRHWSAAAALALSVLGTQAAVAIVKGIVSRPRPAANESLADAGGWSFPSGHSATSIALFATLAIVVGRHCDGPVRLALLVILGALIAAVGLSRVYLGAHYPTDVLGGWLLGGSLVVGCWALASRLPSRGAPAPASS